MRSDQERSFDSTARVGRFGKGDPYVAFQTEPGVVGKDKYRSVIERNASQNACIHMHG